MNLIASVALVVAATFLLTFSSIAIILSPPVNFDSRNLLTIAEFASGLALATLAAIELRRVSRALRAAAA